MRLAAALLLVVAGLAAPARAQREPSGLQALVVGAGATAGIVGGALAGAGLGVAMCESGRCGGGFIEAPVAFGAVVGAVAGASAGARGAHAAVGGRGWWIEGAGGALAGLLGGAGLAQGLGLPVEVGAAVGGVALGAWLYTRPLRGPGPSSIVVAPGAVAYVRRF